MLRKFTGGATLLLGMAVLLTGFYAPAHSTIYFQYLTLLDNVQAISQAFVKEPTGTAQRVLQSATATLASRFNWDTEQIAKFVPVVVSGCATDSLACYAQCEERLGSEKVWAEQQRQIAAHNEELAQLQWPGQGEVIVSGSSTLFPLTEHMATCYAYRTEQQSQRDAPQLRIQLASVGTHGNLDQFCNGAEDLHNASDKITVDEFRAHGCADLTADELVELTVAQDALTIVRGKPVAGGDNDEFPVALNQRQLRFLLAYADRWVEVDPSGADKPIVRYYPGLDSGTRAVLINRVFAGSKVDPATVFNHVNYIRPHEDDAWAARQIAHNPNAIGFFGYRFYREQQAYLIALPIDGKQPEEIEEYPLMRPLYLYTTRTKLAEKPLLRDFVHYYLLALDEYSQNVGYLPLQRAERETAVRTFEALLATMLLPQ